MLISQHLLRPLSFSLPPKWRSPAHQRPLVDEVAQEEIICPQAMEISGDRMQQGTVFLWQGSFWGKFSSLTCAKISNLRRKQGYFVFKSSPLPWWLLFLCYLGDIKNPGNPRLTLSTQVTQGPGLHGPWCCASLNLKRLGRFQPFVSVFHSNWLFHTGRCTTRDLWYDLTFKKWPLSLNISVPPGPCGQRSIHPENYSS